MVEVQRTDLVAQYVGGTAIKTKKKIKEADGGILFVDEAYRLSSNSERVDYGKEAIETMMEHMTSNEYANPVFVFAGYGKEMKDFLEVNAGLNRRIKNRLLFKSFVPVELAEITKKKLNESKKYPHDADTLLFNCFKELSPRVIDEHNASLCEDLIDKIQFHQEKRLSLNCSMLDLEKFTSDDFRHGIKDFLDHCSNYGSLKRDIGTMTDLGKDDIQSPPAVILNIPNKDPVFSSPM